MQIHVHLLLLTKIVGYEQNIPVYWLSFQKKHMTGCVACHKGLLYKRHWKIKLKYLYNSPELTLL